VTATPAWLLVVMGLLGACVSDYESFEPPPLDFSDLPPLDLAVERVAIDSAYRSAGEPPYLDHLMRVSPEAATRALLVQRLRAVGGTDRLQVLILEASVQEETLEPHARPARLLHNGDCGPATGSDQGAPRPAGSGRRRDSID
jgi:hypothetical protein